MKKQITLTNQQIAESHAALSLLTAHVWMAILPGFDVAKNKAALTPHAKDYNEFRQAIIKRYAHLDGAGNPMADHRGEAIFTSIQAKTTALAEIAELDTIEVVVEILTVTLADIAGEEKKSKLPPDVLGILDWMIEEEETPTTPG